MPRRFSQALAREDRGLRVAEPAEVAKPPPLASSRPQMKRWVQTGMVIVKWPTGPEPPRRGL